jgi:hypothetical protein
MNNNKRRTEKIRTGFTLIEVLIGGTILLIVILGALSVYMRSNRVTVDQQQFAEIQNEVRSSMFLVSRDVRSSGVGLLVEIAGYFLEGVDSYGPGPEGSDSIRLFGNFDDPLFLQIEDYSGGEGGGAATAFLYEWSLENAPYDCPDFYEDKTFLIISTRCPGCYTYRYVAPSMVHGCGEGEEHVNFTPGSSELNPPGGLVDTGCAAECWIDAIITLGQVRLVWLDTTGNPGDYAGLNLSPGLKGYTGVPNTLYITTTNSIGGIVHLAMAQNIENLQFQYNGDLNDDGSLDGFTDWDASWTLNPSDDETTRAAKLDIIKRIQQVRIWILGKTPNPYISRTGASAPEGHLYRRPTIANSSGAVEDDRHRRFLLESSVTVRNLALNLYNTGDR